MKFRRFFIIIISLSLLGSACYLVYEKIKNPSGSIGGGSTMQTTSIAEVIRGDIEDSINVIGRAELANEQKLKFLNNGKITDIYVSIGDTVHKGDVLANLDKRTFFEDLKRAQSAIETAQKNINEEREKANGPEARKMARDIASMERRLAEAQEEFEILVQNSPGKSEEKLLDLNAKKRELQTLKDKYEIDSKTYKTEYDARDVLVKSEIEKSEKLVKNTIQNVDASYSDMKNIYDGINRIFGFDQSKLTGLERTQSIYVSSDTPGLRHEAENLWRETKSDLDSYKDTIFRIDRNSKKTQDAQDLVNSQLRLYKKLLNLVDASRRAIDATPATGAGLSAEDIISLQSTVAGYRSTINSQISTLSESRDSFVVAESSEKIEQKVLLGLQEKKFALESQYDAIRRLELEIKQAMKGIDVTENGRVISKALKREILDKQSALQDQKDDILTRKEEYAKLKSGKSDTMERLLEDLKDKKSQLEKMRTEEEKYEIIAPFDGTIRNIGMKVGDVIGNDTAVDGEKAIFLENSDIINIKVNLNQLDITKVKMGQKANVTFSSFPNIPFEGTITEVSSTPTTGGDGYGGGGGQSSMYEIVVAVPRGEHPIRSGMDARITINLDKRENVLMVPITAVSEDVAMGGNQVKVIEPNGSIKKVNVTTGDTKNGMIQIIDGLEEGQQVQVIDFDANQFGHDDFTPNY